MKKINLNHRSRVVALEEMKKYGKDSILDSKDGVFFIMYNDDKKVETKKVVKTSLVDILDQDDNNHITQKEVVEHFVKTKSVKEAVKILDEIDSDNNGRITKKEVKDFVKKDDK